MKTKMMSLILVFLSFFMAVKSQTLDSTKVKTQYEYKQIFLTNKSQLTNNQNWYITEHNKDGVISSEKPFYKSIVDGLNKYINDGWEILDFEVIQTNITSNYPLIGYTYLLKRTKI